MTSQHAAEQHLSGKSFIGYSEVGTAKTFQHHNPATGEALRPAFAEATSDNVSQAVGLARAAFTSYRSCPPPQKAAFLSAVAAGLRADAEAIIRVADQETALGEARLKGELERTASQLELFARVVEAGDWLDARIETDGPDLRRMLVGLGPVAVFGSSNFPLAFSVAGGDTASALAAGCPVVVKGHPSHPGTSETVARVIVQAARANDLPEGVFSLLQSSKPETSLALVEHPEVAALGFTGSGRVGRILFNAASRRKEPIPAFCEMGSVNPVFILPSALNQSEALAQNLANSLTLGAGQFCTNPGITVLPEGPAGRAFTETFAAEVAALAPATMLNGGIFSAYQKGVERFTDTEGVSLFTPGPEHDEAAKRGAHAVLATDAATFLQHEWLQDEVFGPSTLLVFCQDAAERLAVAKALHGQLTATLHADEAELDAETELLSALSDKVGRLIFGGFPTGVAVNHAMQHGGPYPASTDPRFTSVGSAAILRFAKPICFQDYPDALLPPELKRGNPLDIRRLLNGEHSREAG